MERLTFHWADYVVFAITIVISLGIGLYFGVFGSRQKTTSEYFMGNRKLYVIPVMMSILVTFVSGIDLLGNPAEVYSYGTMFSLYIFAQLLGCFMSAFIMVPLFYPLQLTSVTEYYELRFQSKLLRVSISILSLFSLGFVNGIQLFAPSIALGAISDIPVPVSITVVGIVATIYTAIGGIKAVVWTDCFQCLVIISGLLTVAIQGTIAVGGIGKVWEINEEWGHIKFLDLDPDPTKRMTIWSVLVMNTLLWLTLASAQPTVQRYCSLQSMKKARLAILMNSPAFMLSGGLSCFIGFVAFAYYADKGCDPLKSKQIYNANQILPYFVMDVVKYPGLPGLFTACLFSASLSTISSSINSMAAMTYEDFLKNKIDHLKQSTQAHVTKIIVSIYGVRSIVLAFVVMQLGGTLIQITYSIVGSIFGPIIGVLFVGGSLPLVGKYGAMFSFASSLGLSIWLGIGSTFSGIYAPPLDSPIDGCSNINSSIYSKSLFFTTEMSNITAHFDNKPHLTAENYHTYLRGVDRFYAISFLIYPGIGIFCVYFLSLITMWIPMFRQKKLVEKRFLFPGIRHLWCCGVAEDKQSTTDDEKHIIKQTEMAKYEHNNDTKNLLTEKISSL